MDILKTTFIVVGFINSTDEIVILNEYDNENKAIQYKEKYQSRKSIYNSFDVIKETYPAKFNSYNDYIQNKYKK